LDDYRQENVLDSKYIHPGKKMPVSKGEDVEITDLVKCIK